VNRFNVERSELYKFLQRVVRRVINVDTIRRHF